MSALAPERFWPRADRSGGPDACWPWTGNRTPRGYGRIHVGSGDIRAHRVAWMHARGPIPDGMLVLHRCDNPPCVNPAHLFLGTDGDNARDRQAKGRTVLTPGRTGSPVLTRSQVESIRAARAAGATQQSLADLYGVCRTTVGNIVRGTSWRT